MLTPNLYALLGILEVITVVVLWAGVMTFKWRRASRDVAALRQQLKEAPIVSSLVVAAPMTTSGSPLIAACSPVMAFGAESTACPRSVRAWMSAERMPGSSSTTSTRDMAPP